MTTITEHREVPVADIDWNDDGQITIAVHVDTITPQSARAISNALDAAVGQATEAGAAISTEVTRRFGLIHHAHPVPEKETNR